MKAWTLTLLLMAGCAVSQEKKLNIELKNDTPYMIQFEAASLPFRKVVTLGPGESWNGWVLSQMAGKKIFVRIAEKKP